TFNDNAGSSLVLTAGKRLDLQGNPSTVLNSVPTTQVTLNAGSFVRYSGSSTTIDPFSFKTLEVSAGTALLTANITVANNITVDASTLDVDSSGPKNIDVQGNFTLNNGGQFAAQTGLVTFSGGNP